MIFGFLGFKLRVIVINELVIKLIYKIWVVVKICNCGLFGNNRIFIVMFKKMVMILLML